MSKQVLDVQQMQHLQELGLDTSKASMHYWIIRNGEYSQEVGEYVFSKEPSYITLKLHPYEFMSDVAIRRVEDIPTFTLQDVLDALPKSLEIGKSKYEISIYMIEGKWAVDYYSETDADIQSPECENLIDAVYSRLCWAIENKFVETNKNK